MNPHFSAISSSPAPLLRWVPVLVLACALGAGVPAGAAPPKSAPASKSKPAPPEAQSASGVVNINTAGPEQLELLPGIGPSKAKAIVAYRTKHKFNAPQELMRVRGVGRKIFGKLRPYLTLNGPTTLGAKPKRAEVKPH